MDSSNTTDNKRFYDEDIGAFLARESSRRTRQRPADTDVVATIRRRRSRQWPTRALAGVAAATLLVGLGVVASALVLRPSTGIGSSPSPASTEPPMRLPAVAAGQPCPVSQPTTPEIGQASLLGDGPVQLAIASSAGSVFFEATPGGRWKAIDVLWMAAPGFTGQVLVRGARLDGPGELGFGDPADPLRELRITRSVQTPTIDGRVLLAATMPVRVKVAGCYGLQIDAGGRSSIVVFDARPIEVAFAQLERPLQLPAAGSAGCPVTSTTKRVPFVSVVLGDGPVYIAGEGSFSIAGSRQSGGYWFVAEVWIADSNELGPILVRGGRLDAPGELRFGHGLEPAGELRLRIHSYEHAPGQPPGWRIFNTYLRPPSPGCYAMQLDTFTGSRWLVFDVTL